VEVTPQAFFPKDQPVDIEKICYVYCAQGFLAESQSCSALPEWIQLSPAGTNINMSIPSYGFSFQSCHCVYPICELVQACLLLVPPPNPNPPVLSSSPQREHFDPQSKRFLIIYPFTSQTVPAGYDFDGHHSSNEATSSTGAGAGMAGLEVESSGKEQGGEAEVPIAPMSPLSAPPSSSVSPVSVEEQEKAGGKDGSKDGEAEGVVPGSAEASVSAPPSASVPPVSVEGQQEKAGGEDESEDGEAEGLIPPSAASAATPVSASSTSSVPPVSVEEHEEGGEDGLKGGKEPEMIDLVVDDEVALTAKVKASVEIMPTFLTQLSEDFPNIQQHPAYLGLQKVKGLFGNYVRFQVIKTEKEMEGK